MPRAAVLAGAADLPEIRCDSIANGPVTDVRTDLDNEPGGFVTRYTPTIEKVRTGMAVHVQITAADASSLHLDEDFMCCGHRIRSLVTNGLPFTGIAESSHRSGDNQFATVDVD